VFILAEGAPGVVSSTGWRENQHRTPLAQSVGNELYVLGQDGGEGGLAQLSEFSLLTLTPPPLFLLPSVLFIQNEIH
jgi:hypothetical protein